MTRPTFQFSRRKFLKLAGASALLMPLAVRCSTSGPVRFGLITDSHYADREPSGKRYYRDSLQKMGECIGIMNQEKVDFIVHLGDFKDQGADQMEDETLGFLKTIEAEYAKFEGPRYHCIGNHDVDSIRKHQFLENVENTGISNDKSYYSFDSGGVHFVVLDANYHKDGRDQFYKEGADWQDPNIPESELVWLQEDLASINLPTIVFCHQPLYPFEGHGANMTVNNYLDAQGIMEKSTKVMAVFQGHVHDENYKTINGIHYSTQHGMVDHSGLENNSFSIVTINEGNIQLDGYKRVSDHLFS